VTNREFQQRWNRKSAEGLGDGGLPRPLQDPLA
jgi:hypothetical protein